MIKVKPFLLPVLLAFIISGFYIISIPTGIGGDAKEYEGLANSILTGEYSLDGVPSMQREPGYPLFLAIIKTVSSNPKIILWVQALLYILIVLFVGITINKIEPRLSNLGAWAASLSYGLAFYTSTHLSETFVAFLLATIGLIFVLTLEKPDIKHFALISILSGILILTRYTYILVPIALLSILAISSFKQSGDKKKILKNLGFSFLIIFLIVSPWILRNYIMFGEINVAGRSGGVLYARAWKADKSWRSLGDSYLSAFLGRGLLFTVYPENHSIWTDQWGDWWRDPETIKKMWGSGTVSIDQKRKAEAFKIMFGSINNFSKFIMWTGVDELRLLQLPNPIPQAYGSPFEGTYGPLAKEGKLSFIQLTGLLLVHLIQLLWFIGVFVATYLGFKKYGFKFLPGIFLICILLPHSIADNTARYGTPLEPWLLSAIFMTILIPIYTKFKSKFN